MIQLDEHIFQLSWFNHKTRTRCPGRIQKSNNLSGRCASREQSLGRCYPNQRTAKDHFFCFRPGKMGRIWRSFCWKRATVFMASFDDPLVSIPHVSIISSTRRGWWGMMGGRSKWLMWLMWLRCDWDVIDVIDVTCDWRSHYFWSCMRCGCWKRFVSWSSNPPHPKRFRVGTDEVLL